jgi:hypothetical protein
MIEVRPPSSIWSEVDRNGSAGSGRRFDRNDPSAQLGAARKSRSSPTQLVTSSLPPLGSSSTARPANPTTTPARVPGAIASPATRR